MPSQFTPADRDTVRSAIEEHSHVHDTTTIGGGLMVLYHASSHDVTVRGYDGLTRKHGWYVALYEPDENGDKAILMPITEVDGE